MRPAAKTNVTALQVTPPAMARWLASQIPAAELRLDPALRLPMHAENLEARLILLDQASNGFAPILGIADRDGQTITGSELATMDEPTLRTPDNLYYRDGGVHFGYICVNEQIECRNSNVELWIDPAALNRARAAGPPPCARRAVRTAPVARRGSARRGPCRSSPPASPTILAVF
jgi:hypothetical protein